MALNTTNKVKSDEKLVMIVDDDRGTLEFLAALLETEGKYKIKAFDKAKDALEWLEVHENSLPNIIISDIAMPGMNGYEFGRKLGESHRLRRIPLIYLSGMIASGDGLNAREKAEYLPKGIDIQELLAIIRAKLSEHELRADIQPLTGLPAGVSIERATKSIIETYLNYALCYIDLDNFKHYNDNFGADAGNGAITAAASAIDRALRKTVGTDYFLGHIGGDDFVAMIWNDGDPVAVCDNIFLEIGKALRKLYCDEDLKRGYFEARNSKGGVEKFGLLSVSIGVITSDVKRVKDCAEASGIFVELKKKAKSIKGNSYYVNRRLKSQAERIS